MAETAVIDAAKAAADEAAKKAAEVPKTDPPKEEPKLILGKFKTQEELEKSYAELEKKLGAKPKTADPSPMQIGSGVPAGEDLPIPDLVKKAGLEMDDLEKQFTEKGDLTPEQYTALNKANPGLSKSSIKLIAEGMAAKAALRIHSQERIFTEAAAMVGDADKLRTFLANAEQFVPADELDETQARLQDPKRFKGAIRDMLAWHAEKNGSSGSATIIVGGSRVVTGGGARNHDEYQSLMKQYREGKDVKAQINATPESVKRKTK